MTPAERFEEALRDLLASWREGFPREYQEAVRFAHAACVEDARNKNMQEAIRGVSMIRCVSKHLGVPHGNRNKATGGECGACEYERGLREGAEREREACAKLLLYCGFEGSATAIRTRSKGGDSPV